MSLHSEARYDQARGWVDPADNYRLLRGAVADREDALLATTHRPDSRSATRRIRNKSVAEGVTLPEV
jgi:hypothetical protein